MLRSLYLKKVGPAPEMKMKLAPRLNLIAGDNGLGKSFLLDVAWWALTRTWALDTNGKPLTVVPRSPKQASIKYSFTTKARRSYQSESRFDPMTSQWSVRAGRPPIPGLILYARVDGGFSVWDPARNYWRDGGNDRPRAFLFRPSEVWEGNDLCEGLIRDWGSWQREGGEAFETLKKVLKVLSPPTEPLVPGGLRKLTVDDPRRYPTLQMPYGEDVAVVHASAGMRRIIALTYLLSWAWQEHLAAAKLREEQPAQEIIFLIDEIEAHLHPKWQRCIVPALLQVMEVLTGGHGSRVQLIAATHSPLVLASVEPSFDIETDKLFLLELEDRVVALHEKPWAMQGDAASWLVSDTFDLRQARSVEAERAIEAAEALMRGETATLPADLRTKEAIHAELQRVLAGHDRFWPRWIVSYERSGGRA